MRNHFGLKLLWTKGLHGPTRSLQTRRPPHSSEVLADSAPSLASANPSSAPKWAWPEHPWAEATRAPVCEIKRTLLALALAPHQGCVLRKPEVLSSLVASRHLNLHEGPVTILPCFVSCRTKLPPSANACYVSAPFSQYMLWAPPLYI